MKNLILLIILLCILLIHCKKDVAIPKKHNINTLQPRSYYPVFPGSYWRYTQNDTTIILDTTSATYIKHSYMTAREYINGSYVNSYSDTVYVPFLNNKPIYQYNKIEHRSPPFQAVDVLWPILSERLGFKYTDGWADVRYGDFREHLTVFKKIVNNNNDSTIVVKGHWVYGPSTKIISYRNYVKNIGLFSHYEIDTVAMDTIYKLELTSYFINN